MKISFTSLIIGGVTACLSAASTVEGTRLRGMEDLVMKNLSGEQSAASSGVGNLAFTFNRNLGNNPFKPVVITFSRLYDSVDQTAAQELVTQLSFVRPSDGDEIVVDDFRQYWGGGLGGDSFGFGFDETCIVDVYGVENDTETEMILSKAPADYTMGKILIKDVVPLSYLGMGLAYVDSYVSETDFSLKQYVLKPTDDEQTLAAVGGKWEFSGGPNPFLTGNPTLQMYSSEPVAKLELPTPFEYTSENSELPSAHVVQAPQYRLPAYFAEEFALDQTSGEPVLSYVLVGTITDGGSLNGLDIEQGPLYLDEKYPSAGFPPKLFTGSEYGFVKVKIPSVFDARTEEKYKGVGDSTSPSESSYDLDFWSLSSNQVYSVDDPTNLNFGVSGVQLNALQDLQKTLSADSDRDYAYVVFAPRDQVLTKNFVALLPKSQVPVFTVASPSGGFVQRMKNPNPNVVPWGLGRFTDNPQVEDSATEEEQWKFMEMNYGIDQTQDYVGIETYVVDSEKVNSLIDIYDYVDNVIMGATQPPTLPTPTSAPISAPTAPTTSPPTGSVPIECQIIGCNYIWYCRSTYADHCPFL